MSQPKRRLKILLAIDDSPYSMAALNLLTRISWPQETSVHVLTFVSERLPLMETILELRRQVDETIEIRRWRDWSAAKILTAQAKSELQSHNLVCTTEMCEGYPVEVILDRTAELSPDLIVIGATGFETFGEFRLNSMAHKLIQQANCSLLIARPAEYVRPISTIFVMDGSAEMWAAVKFLCALSLPNWAKVTVVNLATNEAGVPVGLAPALYQPYPKEEYTTRVIEYLQECDVRVWRAVRFGSSVDKVLAVAREEDASLIVLGMPAQAVQHRDNYLFEQFVLETGCSVLTIQEGQKDRARSLYRE